MSKERISLGKRGEDIAAAFLEGRGVRIVARNYRRRGGEIDIICRDGDTHVFVEVKTRIGSACGDPLEAVTSHKQRRIYLAALDYLSRNRLLDEPARFDVIGVSEGGGEPDITHIVGAFEVP